MPEVLYYFEHTCGFDYSEEDFVTRLIDIQPSKPANCLELELLRSKVDMRDAWPDISPNSIQL